MGADHLPRAYCADLYEILNMMDTKAKSITGWRKILVKFSGTKWDARRNFVIGVDVWENFDAKTEIEF